MKLNGHGPNGHGANGGSEGDDPRFWPAKRAAEYRMRREDGVVSPKVRCSRKTLTKLQAHIEKHAPDLSKREKDDIAAWIMGAVIEGCLEPFMKACSEQSWDDVLNQAWKDARAGKFNCSHNFYVHADGSCTMAFSNGDTPVEFSADQWTEFCKSMNDNGFAFGPTQITTEDGQLVRSIPHRA